MDFHRASMPYPKAMAYTNYNDDQVLFIDALFLVTLLDCAGHYDHVDNQLTCVKIAKAFAYIRYIFEHSDPGDFDNAFSISFIRQYRLDTPQGMMDYIANHSPPTSTKLPTSTLTGRHREYYFPYSIDLHKADDKNCGGVGYLRGMEEHHIHVRRFTGAEVNMFLRFYAESIPMSFHDDLAVLTEKLRLDIWCRMIRSQTVCCLPNGMEAVTRLTKEYNVWKRAANRRRPMDEPNQLPPTDQQFQAETLKRKVTNGALENELRDGLKDDLESVLWNGLVGNLTDFNVATVEEVDKHRQQQRQSQETEKLAQRNTAITEYMNKITGHPDRDAS